MYCNQSDLCGRDIVIVGGWRIIMDNMDRNGVFAQSLLLPSIYFFLSSHSRYPENARWSSVYLFIFRLTEGDDTAVVMHSCHQQIGMFTPQKIVKRNHHLLLWTQTFHLWLRIYVALDEQLSCDDVCPLLIALWHDIDRFSYFFYLTYKYSYIYEIWLIVGLFVSHSTACRSKQCSLFYVSTEWWGRCNLSSKKMNSARLAFN